MAEDGFKRIVPRIEYDCNGAGRFSFLHIGKDGNPSEPPQLELSFYDSYIYCLGALVNSGEQIPLIRVEGLARRLKTRAEMQKIFEFNNRS